MLTIDNVFFQSPFFASTQFAQLDTESFEITLCLVRQSFSWAPSERLAVLDWRLFLQVWCWRSELLSQLGPAGEDRVHIVAETSKLVFQHKRQQRVVSPTTLTSGHSNGYLHRQTPCYNACSVINYCRLNMHKKPVCMQGLQRKLKRDTSSPVLSFERWRRMENKSAKSKKKN